ncbi:hypothetical protein K0M31_002159, partial [Melipona bicolor]
AACKFLQEILDGPARPICEIPILYRLIPLKAGRSNVITDYTRGYTRYRCTIRIAETRLRTTGQKVDGANKKKRKIVTSEETRHSKEFPTEGEYYLREFECDSANDPYSCTCIRAPAPPPPPPPFHHVHLKLRSKPSQENPLALPENEDPRFRATRPVYDSFL